MATSIILAAPAPPTSHSDGECPPSSQALVPFLLDLLDLQDLQDPEVLQVQPALFPVPKAPPVQTAQFPVPKAPMVPKAPPVQTA